MLGAFLCSKEFERKERKMDFEQFKENVKNDLEARFRTNGTGDVNISYGQITKPNETYEAITVRGEDDQVGVNLNVTRMYEAMQEGDSYLEVLQKAAETMMEIMGEDMFGDLGLNIPDEDEKMFVATVPDKIHGAGVIAYPDFMEQASEKLGGDFYILPSSLHEVLLVKDNCDMSLHELKQMVQEVNETQVSPEEKLTDNVYHYDSQDKVFEIGDKFELRQATRVMEGSYGMDDKSVLKDLASKKIDAKSNALQSSSSKEVLDKGAHKQKAGESLGKIKK